VPGALERKVLWLAPEHIAGRSVADVAQLMNGYKTQLLQTQPIDGDGANEKVIVVFSPIFRQIAQRVCSTTS
jgi:hypothetical protein